MMVLSVMVIVKSSLFPWIVKGIVVFNANSVNLVLLLKDLVKSHWMIVLSKPIPSNKTIIFSFNTSPITQIKPILATTDNTGSLNLTTI